MRKRASNGMKQVVYEKADGAGACTSSRKMAILSHRKATAEPNVFFRQKAFEDCIS
jgi:hypothetical protein